MPTGPGKYGGDAERLIEEYGATLCLIITVGGTHGSSFDVATSDPQLLLTVPGLLRKLAASMEVEVGADLDAIKKHGRN